MSGVRCDGLKAFVVASLLVFGSRATGNPPAGIGSEFRVNSFTANDQGGFGNGPSVDRNDTGDFIVVWSSQGQDADNFGVYAQRYHSSGTAADTEFRVNTTTAGSQTRPAVALDANGAFVVVWEDSAKDGSGKGVFAQRFNSAGVAAGTEFPINTTTSQDQSYPAVSSDDAGNFIVVWRNLSFLPGPVITEDIFGRRFSSLGVALTDEFTVNSTTAKIDTVPDVAMSANGAFVATWLRGLSGSAEGIFVRRYNSAGAAQGSEFLANSYTSARFMDKSAVSLDDSGKFVVVWQSNGQPGGFGWDVFGRRFSSAGAAQDSEFQVDTSYIFGEQLRPDVSLDADGDFVVVWTGLCASGCGLPDASVSMIVAKAYQSDGTAVGSEFQVNTFSTDRQDDPAVAMNQDQGFVVTWDSNLQDTSGEGVYAQLFVTATPTATETPTFTESPTSTPTETPTITETSTPGSTNTRTKTRTRTSTRTPTATATSTSAVGTPPGTSVPSFTPTSRSTAVPSETPTATASGSPQGTATPTPSGTLLPALPGHGWSVLLGLLVAGAASHLALRKSRRSA